MTPPVAQSKNFRAGVFVWFNGKKVRRARRQGMIAFKAMVVTSVPAGFADVLVNRNTVGEYRQFGRFGGSADFSTKFAKIHNVHRPARLV